MRVALVHPVAMRRALFCIVWRVLMCVLAMLGDHVGDVYVVRGRMMALNVVSMVSLFWPQDLPVRALSVLRRFLAFFVCFVCGV